jgi:hypothetical protein
MSIPYKVLWWSIYISSSSLGNMILLHLLNVQVHTTLCVHFTLLFTKEICLLSNRKEILGIRILKFVLLHAHSYSIYFYKWFMLTQTTYSHHFSIKNESHYLFFLDKYANSWLFFFVIKIHGIFDFKQCTHFSK